MCARAGKDDSGMVRGLGTGESRRVRPSSTASRIAAASNVPSVVSQPPLGTERVGYENRWMKGYDQHKVNIRLMSRV
jgi:hypothetical protein